MVAEPPVMHQAERTKVWLRLLVLFFLVTAVTALVGLPIVGGAKGLGGGVAIAAIMIAGAAAVHFSWAATLRPEARTRRGETTDGPAFHIRLRPQLPLMYLAIGLGFLTFFGIAAAALGSGSGGSTVWAILCGLGALFGLALVPDAIRALAATGREAVLDPTGFTYTGYAYETRVAWDDIASVRVESVNRQPPSLRFDLRPGAAQTWHRRWWVAHLEPAPRPERFRIPGIVFDQPWDLLALCRGMAAAPANHRVGYLDSVGTSLLTTADLGRG